MSDIATTAVTAATATAATGTPATGRPVRHLTDAQKALAMQKAKEFESVLLGQFTSIMFSGIKGDGPFGGGPAEDIYRNMLSTEYGKVLANSGGIGLADAVYREIIQTQEVA